MTPAELERKVRRVDNDVQAIYELLHAISGTQARHGRRLDEFDVRFDGVDARFDTVDARFDAVDARLESVDSRLDSVDSKVDEILTLVRER